MISFELSCLLNGVFWLKAFFKCFCVDRWRVLSVGELRRDTLMLFNSKIPTRLDFSFLSQTQSFFFQLFFLSISFTARRMSLMTINDGHVCLFLISLLLSFFYQTDRSARFECGGFRSNDNQVIFCFDNGDFSSFYSVFLFFRRQQ